MFPVINRLRSKTDRTVLNILLIQNGYERYCKHLSLLDNVNIYLYNPWKIPDTHTPNNVITVYDKEIPIVGSFDKIICIGKTEVLEIAEQIRKRFGIELIVVADSSEKTYCPRPFTFAVRNRIEYQAEQEIAISSCLNLSDLSVVPYVEEDSPIGLSKKENTVCIFNHVPTSIVGSVATASQHPDPLEFNHNNIASSKVFLDTMIGYTPHLLEALYHGCVPVVPHCDEIERLLAGLGYMYKDYSEIKGCINAAKNDKTDRGRFREIYQRSITSKQDFINKWNYILGRGQY